MDWIAPTISAVSVLAAYLLGHYLSQRSAAKQWERDLDLRKAEWQREDARRWDKERLTAYRRVVTESLKLLDIVVVISQEWNEPSDERDDGLSTLLLDQNAVLAHARADAILVASMEMRPALQRLSDVVAMSRRVLQSDHGSETRAAFLERFNSEFGDALADFTKAAKKELGAAPGKVDDLIESE